MDVAGAIAPVLLAGFSLRGEPNAATPEDAFDTFRRSGPDVPVLGDVVVRR